MRFLEKYYVYVKWSIILSAYGFLCYKLCTFDGYNAISDQWKDVSGLRAVWILTVFFLLPFNWLIESCKWRYLISDIEEISLWTSFKSILSGITFGFFTPNRIGEFPGRSVYLKNGHRLNAIALGFIGTLAQTLSLLMCGIPAALIFFTLRKNMASVPDYWLWLFFVATAVLFLGVYLFLPSISRFFLRRNVKNEKVKEIFVSLAGLSGRKLVFVFLISFSRYILFCVQFYCMLRFFNVGLSVWEAVVGIASNYLFVTFTPSVAFAEVAVRGSYAMIFIGAFSDNLVGVTAAGMGIWFVNYCIPMIVGSVCFSKTRLR